MGIHSTLLGPAGEGLVGLSQWVPSAPAVNARELCHWSIIGHATAEYYFDNDISIVH